ncbi:MAG: glycosyltransferase [Fimbriimonadaceae bacterium]
MDAGTARISVAVPTLGKETLLATLRSLERQTVRPCEVLVVNQGPAGLESKLSFDLPIRVLDMDVRGLSLARNRAIETFAGDWVLFTDDDQECNAEWVEQCGNLIREYPEADVLMGVVLPPIRYDSEKLHVSTYYAFGERFVDASNYGLPGVMPREVTDMRGGNFAISRKCIDRVGAFDPSFGRGSGVLDAGEDTDLGLRVVSAGLKILTTCRLIVYHTYGPRPKQNVDPKEYVQTMAGLYWKSVQPSSPISPDLSKRLIPFGGKKALLGKLLFGAVFREHVAAKRVFDATMAMFDRDFVVRDGILHRK